LKVFFSALAERDLDEVYEYVALDNADAAAETVLRVIDATDGLAAYPNIGRPGRVPGTRELVIGGTPFIAAYRVRENEVTVLRVLHGARRWGDRSDPATS